MTMYKVPYTDLNMPLTPKTRAKLIGKLEQVTHKQDAAATAAGAIMWIATFDGRLGDAYIVIDTIPGSGESMVYDLLKNGVSMLTATKTIDENTVGKGQHSLRDLFDLTKIHFAVGDVITVSRTYTEGAGATETNSVTIEPSVAPYES